jgi:NADH:ubiquinone oxidoreductase subunit 5 (subunit L)/multisubunit Na+/H+ antiporter MnhA subunit
MPLTTLLMVLAGLSLAGMPFFSGFASKTLLEEAAVEAGFGWAAWVIVLGGIFSFAAIFRLVYLVFAPWRGHVFPHAVRDVPYFLFLPILALVLGSILVGVAPQIAIDGLAFPAAVSLFDRQGYIQSVMQTDESPPGPVDTPHAVHSPDPYDLSRWGLPAVVVLLGGALAVILVRADRRDLSPWPTPVETIAGLLRRWHSGVVSDYALWNAFGTALLPVILLLAFLTDRL